jgi:hypothetical protein
MTLFLPLLTLKAPSSKKSKTKKTHFPQHKKKQSWKAWVFGNPKSSWKKEKDETRKVHILTARKDFLAPNRIFNNMKVVQNSKRVYLLNLFPIINLYITSTCKKKNPNYLEGVTLLLWIPFRENKKEESYAYDLGVGKTLRF